MTEEADRLKDIMSIDGEASMGDRTYYSGKIGNVKVTLVFSRWGKVASSSTTTTLINKFNVDFVIFTGVAGAVDDSLNIGDVVIGSELYQHDMDARPIFPRFQIPLTDASLFSPKQEDIDSLQKAAYQFTQQIQQKIPEKTLSKFSIFKPKVYTGVIASGDQFISDPKTHDSLKLDSKKVLSVEMEGAAVAQVCHEHSIPFTVVRTISDKADHSASVDFQSFVSEITSHYSEGIISNLLIK